MGRYGFKEFIVTNKFLIDHSSFPNNNYDIEAGNLGQHYT